MAVHSFLFGGKVAAIVLSRSSCGFPFGTYATPHRETRFHNPANFPSPWARTFSAYLAATTMSARLSGVQREVNQLYRRVLRAAKLKDGGSGSTTRLVKTEFREQARKEGLVDHRERFLSSSSRPMHDVIIYTTM